MTTSPTPRTQWAGRLALAVALASATVLVALGTPAMTAASAGTTSSAIVAVGAENEYANVLSQIGGKYVAVTSILDNPNTDPHTFEASPSVAEAISRAKLIVQNGVGYDGFMNKIEAASSNPKRKIIVAQKVLGLAPDTANPHLWYSPRTMPAVAKVIEEDLATLEPDHAAYFRSNLTAFTSSLQPWLSAIAAFKAKYAGTPVAVTEPVADYLLKAMGAKVLTPFVFQADIMNGVDPVTGGHRARGGLLHETSGQGVLLQPASRRFTHVTDQTDRPLVEGPRRRRLRDNAHAGLRLPDLDVGRSEGD